MTIFLSILFIIGIVLILIAPVITNELSSTSPGLILALIGLVVVSFPGYLLTTGHFRSPAVMKNSYYRLVGTVPIGGGQTMAVLEYGNGDKQAVVFKGEIVLTNGSICTINPNGTDYVYSIDGGDYHLQPLQ